MTGVRNSLHCRLWLCDVVDGRIVDVVGYCSGEWNEELRRRHAVEAPMILAELAGPLHRFSFGQHTCFDTREYGMMFNRQQQRARRAESAACLDFTGGTPRTRKPA